jgi:F-type H+-transporting ATPase subunit delta
MKISKQARREAKALFRATQINGVMDEERVRAAINELVARKPRGYLSIMTQMERLVRLDIFRRNARVESVVPLDGALEGSLKAALTRRYGLGLQFSFGVNPSLIAGMRVQVGSDVYDGSVRARLDALQDNFSST